MTIKPYIIGLEIACQVEILYQDGIYLGKRREGRSTVILYQFGSWYVEIFFKKYRSAVKNIVWSTSVDILEPYLEKINIEPLLSVK